MALFFLLLSFSLLSRSNNIEEERKWKSKRQRVRSCSMEAMTFFTPKNSLFLAVIFVCVLQVPPYSLFIGLWVICHYMWNIWDGHTYFYTFYEPYVRYVHSCSRMFQSFEYGKHHRSMVNTILLDKLFTIR